MATWRDGAEYAPTERPDGFATPAVEPFTEEPPWRAATPGPGAGPQGFEGPDTEPLSAYATGATAHRDPRDAFEVGSMTLTPTARPGDTRDPRQPIVTSAPRTLGPEWTGSDGTSLPPPTGRPLPPPTGSPLPPPAWPAPPSQPGQVPYAGPPPLPSRGRTGAPVRTQRQLALVAGGLSLLGVLLPAAAPFLLVGAGALGLRTTALTGRAGSWALGTGIATLGFRLLTDTLGEPSFIGQLASLGFLFAFVLGGLRSR